MSGPVRGRLTFRDLWEFVAPTDWATQWYWPEGVHGKMWNFFHGHGWRVVLVVHRGIPEHGPWWKLGRDLLFLACAAGVFSALFILGDLAIYGHVNW